MNQALILAQVARIRSDAEAFLLDTAYIKRKTGQTVTRGQTTFTYADPVETVCRLINRSGNDETPIASQFRAVQQSANTSLFKMQLPYDADITIDDKIIYNDEEFDIVHVPVKHEMMGGFVISLMVRT